MVRRHQRCRKGRGRERRVQSQVTSEVSRGFPDGRRKTPVEGCRSPRSPVRIGWVRSRTVGDSLQRPLDRSTVVSRSRTETRNIQGIDRGRVNSPLSSSSPTVCTLGVSLLRSASCLIWCGRNPDDISGCGPGPCVSSDTKGREAQGRRFGHRGHQWTGLIGRTSRKELSGDPYFVVIPV